jgi:surface protein
MKKISLLILTMLLPLLAFAQKDDGEPTVKTVVKVYKFYGTSNDGLLSYDPTTGEDNPVWYGESSYHYWSSEEFGASAIGAHCNAYDNIRVVSSETFPAVIKKITINAGAWSDVSTALSVNGNEQSLSTINSYQYMGSESNIRFDDYVFENVSTSGNNGYLRIDYILSGQADIFIRSITLEYETEVEVGECDMSEIPTDNAYYAATSFLCERGVLDGSKVDGKYLVEDPLLRQHLANISFRGLFTLNGREIPSTLVSDQYPDVYDDLKSDAPYYQAAKALLYLDYGDGITPFDRDRDGFFPNGNESRINILKELMEAFNIKPDMEGTDNPFPNDPDITSLPESSPIKMGYVRQAAKLGIITTENEKFRPYDDCLRGEAFLMLARIIQKIEAGEITDPNPQESDFLDPNSGTGTEDPNAEAYYTVSNNFKTLTFYYDSQKTSRTNILFSGGLEPDEYGFPTWYSCRDKFTSVVFDSSFDNYKTLTSTECWFINCSSVTSITGLEYLHTDNVTNMRSMFYECSSLTNIDLSHFNTENVQNFIGMFDGCSGLTSLDVSGFNTAKATKMSGMFEKCSGLTELNLLNFNTANVIDMNGMFYGCTGLTVLDLSSFNTANVTDMLGMFNNCSNLVTIYVGEGWSTAKAGGSYDNSMFYNCQKLIGGKGFTYDSSKTDKDYARIDNSPTYPGYFTDKNAPAEADAEPYAVLSDDKTVLTFYYDDQKEQRNGMGIGPFANSSDRGWHKHLWTITTAEFDPSFANCMTINSTAFWFSDCFYLTSIKGLQYLKTDKVTDMSHMFFSCRELESVDLSGFITDKVTDMSYMFGSCWKLTSLDLRGFNTSNVTNMSNMFAESGGLKSLDVSGFNTSKVTDMSWMFSGISSVKRIELRGFDTSNVTNMSYMFRYCTGMSVIDISSFKTDNVTVMDKMFNECYGLKTIYVGDLWSTAAVTSSTDMFDFDRSLVGGAGSGYYASDAKDHTMAHIDGGTDNPGYFTYVIQPYAVLSPDNTTLTFYYDDQKEYRGGMGVGPFSDYEKRGWYENTSTITTVVFEESFADCISLRSTAYWFYNCKNITNITGINHLKTDNVTDMYCMFYDCSALTSLDLSGFNTEKVTNMQSMFYDCSGLTSLDISHFNTPNVTYFDSMFSGCSSLTSLDLSGFVTDKATGMGLMFEGCSGLTTIYAGNWSTTEVMWGSQMFIDCTSLVGGAGTKYDANHTHYTYAHIDGGASNPGYFTAKGGGGESPAEETEETIKITSAGQTTWCSAYDLDFTNVAGLKAYIAAGYNRTTGTIWLMRVFEVPAKEGILLMGDPGEYKVPHKSTTTYYKNMFKGTLEDITINETEGEYTNYYLSNGDSGVGFYKVNGSIGIKAHRAYLPLLKGTAQAGTRFIGIEFGDGTTNLTPALSKGEGEGEWYTLQGQRVTKPGKGLYIRNGKKVVIK